MAFYRTILKKLEDWSQRERRKPLILRGARQTGKTTVVNLFAHNFDHYIPLNLELAEDRAFFTQFDQLKDTVRAVLFSKEIPENSERILIFIDEIQSEPKAVAALRYFYEDFPHLFVVAAGSLLETLLASKNTFPVGRVEYLVMRPVSFSEFLLAMNEQAAYEAMQEIPFPAYAQLKLLDLFHTYALIGGMPEVVEEYAQHRDLVLLKPIYESLLTAYLDDVQKYATRTNRAETIRFCIENLFLGGGKRIRFSQFANSNYDSKSIGEALRTLQQAMLLHLVYPSTDTRLPAIPNRRKSPYLQTLDTGLLNFFSGIQQALIGTKDLHEAYRGRVIHHWTGQSLLNNKHSPLDRLQFWVREKKQSMAEVDFVYLWQSKLIPIEVKAGKTGKLRSLRLYMDEAPHQLAVRVYSGDLDIHQMESQSGRSFWLLNLPYFLVEQLDSYLAWMEAKIKEE
ncbi:MAG: AAA family ATPase [Bacteroidota bacterium]